MEKKNSFKETFGTLKRKINTEKILKEIDDNGWVDF